jgi:hypothetical protein
VDLRAKVINLLELWYKRKLTKKSIVLPNCNFRTKPLSAFHNYYE